MLFRTPTFQSKFCNEKGWIFVTKFVVCLGSATGPGQRGHGDDLLEYLKTLWVIIFILKFYFSNKFQFSTTKKFQKIDEKKTGQTEPNGAGRGIGPVKKERGGAARSLAPLPTPVVCQNRITNSKKKIPWKYNLCPVVSGHLGIYSQVRKKCEPWNIK